jgi:uncharacterized protein
MAKSNSLYERILTALWEIRIVDTHEHLPAENERNKNKADLLYEFFCHYASADLISSGMSNEELENMRKKDSPIEKRWKILEPYWQRIQNTGYARSINIAIKGLFDEEGMTRENYMRLAEKLVTANKPGWYRKVLKEKSRIEISILDANAYDRDKELFVPVVRPEEYILVRSREGMQKLEKERSVSLHSLKDLEKAMLGYLDEFVSNGAVGIKLPLAYLRPISYDKTAFSDAEKAFNLVAQSDSNPHMYESYMTFAQMKPMQDYLVHQVLRYAEEKNLPVQIHTGLQEGNANFIRNSDPTLLTNLFIEYPKVRFDLFHASYPFSRLLAVLAKNFRNVFIDMCWFHIMTPTGAQAMLHEWLDLVPANKIFGFGGDYAFVEGVYGHVSIAREDIAKVLAERVEDGISGEDYALELGRMILRENAYNFFDIEKKRKIKAKKKK